MAEFVHPHLGVVTAKEQEHSHTQAAPIAPMGHDAAPVGAVGTFAADEKYDETDQRLGDTPCPLPYPKQQLLHLQNLGMIFVAMTSTNLSNSSFAVSLHSDTRKEPSMTSGESFIAVNTWLR